MMQAFPTEFQTKPLAILFPILLPQTQYQSELDQYQSILDQSILDLILYDNKYHKVAMGFV